MSWGQLQHIWYGEWLFPVLQILQMNMGIYSSWKSLLPGTLHDVTDTCLCVRTIKQWQGQISAEIRAVECLRRHRVLSYYRDHTPRVTCDNRDMCRVTTLLTGGPTVPVTSISKGGGKCIVAFKTLFWPNFSQVLPWLFIIYALLIHPEFTYFQLSFFALFDQLCLWFWIFPNTLSVTYNYLHNKLSLSN